MIAPRSTFTIALPSSSSRPPGGSLPTAPDRSPCATSSPRQSSSRPRQELGAGHLRCRPSPRGCPPVSRSPPSPPRAPSCRTGRAGCRSLRAGGRVVPVAGREVRRHGGVDGRVSSHPFEQSVQGRGGGLRDELVLRREVLVEAAVRQAGSLHQVVEPSRDDPALPELARGRLDDPPAGLRRLLPRFPHGGSSSGFILDGV